MPGLLRVLPVAVPTATAVLSILAAAGWDRARGRDPLSGVGRRAQRYWCGAILRRCGVEVEVRGVPLCRGPVLVAANHVSWLDILVLAREWRLGFLSKSEVARWPGVGPVATALGTLYIERGANHAARGALEAMRVRLAAGGRVVFFPEATTGTGERLLPFRPRLFQAAIDAGVPVQSVAIRYHDRHGQLSAAAPFVGAASMIEHVQGLLASGPIRAEVTVTPAIHPAADGSRTGLARQSAESILSAWEARG
jgi:1-acyl-sn-glycerol-3-phosphate acyltransferase